MYLARLIWRITTELSMASFWLRSTWTRMYNTVLHNISSNILPPRTQPLSSAVLRHRRGVHTIPPLSPMQRFVYLNPPSCLGVNGLKNPADCCQIYMTINTTPWHVVTLQYFSHCTRPIGREMDQDELVLHSTAETSWVPRANNPLP